MAMTPPLFPVLVGTEAVPPGVYFLDHTADVGLDVTAPTLPELFVRAAAGMACLIHGVDRAGDARRATAEAGAAGAVAEKGAAGAAGESAAAEGAPAGTSTLQRSIMVSADDLPALLRAWLREILHRHDAEGLALRGAHFPTLTETVLEAVVTFAPDPNEPIREIKGVTLHGLAVERRGEAWAARVIFDV